MVNDNIPCFWTLHDIQFYEEVSNDIIVDNLYQVQYKKDSKTYTEKFYSDNWRNVKDFFDNVVAGELLEVRKFVYSDDTVKKDNGDYIKRVAVYYSRDCVSRSSFAMTRTALS